MKKFSELDAAFPGFRESKIEEFNIAATEENLRMMRKSVWLSTWTFVVAFLTLIVSGIALAVSLLK